MEYTNACIFLTQYLPIMEMKKVPSWKIEPTEFELDRVLLNLSVLEEGPVTLHGFLKR